MRSLLLLFLIHLLLLILSIIPSFSLIFKICLVSMTLLLTGFHHIFPLVLRQSPSKIPLHLSQIFLKSQDSVHGPLLFTFVQAYWLCHLQELNQISDDTSADDTQLYISFASSNSLPSFQILSTTYSDILSWINSNKLLLNPSKRPKLNFYSLAQNYNDSNFLISQLELSAMMSSQSALLIVLNIDFIFDSDMSFTD